MDVDAPSASGVVQDLPIDTTPLPDNHPPKFLAEARSMYKDSRPPFLIYTSNTSEGSQREVFITNNGQRPRLPIRANLVAKLWGQFAYSGIYWTLDLNGERFIVLSFPNRGCVSGAKWVYCAWTGVGDQFEDLPLAFTCINGEYTCGPDLKAQSAATEKRATTKNDKPNTITAHVTPRPQGHPVEYLDDAEALYVGSRPPFVIHHTRFPCRRVYIATKDGRFSPTSTEAEVVYRPWDALDDFPTLDLNGKRFIVMGNPGGPPGGYQFHLWLGSKVGRVKEVIAYAGPQTSATKEPSALTEQFSQRDEDQSSSSSLTDEDFQEIQEGTRESKEYSYDNFIKAFNPCTANPPAPIQFEIRRPVPSSMSSAQQRHSHSKSKPTKRARSISPSAHIGSGKRRTPDNVTKRNLRPIRHVSDDSADLSGTPYKVPGLTPSTNDQPGPPSETSNVPTEAPISLPNLTLYKQTHTILRVTRDSNIIGFVPLRLMTCMTISTLFDSVVAASGHKEVEEPIKYLMVVFDWKDEDDVYKTIYVDKETQGSFEIFLEIIDESPCWKDEGGKCGIAVEVVRA